MGDKSTDRSSDIKRTTLIVALLAVAIGSFLAGRVSRSAKKQSARRILYYVDSMHPSYRSDHPGTAPDCGMALEPVFEDDLSMMERQSPVRPVAVDPERQNSTGLRVERVHPSTGTRVLRTSGRIAVKENSLYRVLAATDGWVRSIHSNALGSLVNDGEVLATFYSKDFFRAEQSYFFSLKSLERVRSGPHDKPEQIKQAEEQVRASEEELRSLGMGEPQIREIRQKQEITREINIASPSSGLVVAQDLTPGQRLERGAEVYRIANIDRVLILADLFPGVSSSLAPGTKVRVIARELRKTFYAAVSSTVPLFDPVSRVLKLRLEADNPGLLLRPDMFVDIEFDAKAPAGISVPAESVFDNGLQKVIYVESRDGAIEPRVVEVGATFDDRVVVTKGLRDGEHVVVTGNFIIDSESRLRASSPAPATSSLAVDRPLPSQEAYTSEDFRDPVCGMVLSAEHVKAAKYSEDRHGHKLVFCSEQCLKNFRTNPVKYMAERAESFGSSGSSHALAK